MDEEEVPGEPELLDHAELVLDLAVGSRLPLRARRPVALRGLLRDQYPQPGHLVVALGHPEVGQPWRDHAEVERAGAGQLHGPLLHTGETPQPPAHLGAGPDVGGTGSGQPAIHLVEAAAGADRCECLRQARLRRRRVVHVAGGHQAYPRGRGQPGQGVVPFVITGLIVECQLRHDVAGAEHAGQRAQLTERGPGTFGGQGGRNGTLTAAGQYHPMPVVSIRESATVVDRPPLLTSRQLGSADHRAQPPVPLRIPGQHQQMFPLRIRCAGPSAGPHRPSESGAKGPGEWPVNIGESRSRTCGEALVTGQRVRGRRPRRAPVCRRSTIAGREAQRGVPGGSPP